MRKCDSLFTGVWTGALLMFVSTLVFTMFGCAWLGEHGEETGKTVQAASSVLPTPFNWIGGAIGSVLAAGGAYAANKARASKTIAAEAKGVDPVVAWGQGNIFTKLLSERQWLYPFLGTGLSIAKSSGVLPIGESDFVAILSMLGVGAAAEFHATARADRQIATAVCPVPPTAPTPVK